MANYYRCGFTFIYIWLPTVPIYIFLTVNYNTPSGSSTSPPINNGGRIIPTKPKWWEKINNGGNNNRGARGL